MTGTKRFAGGTTGSGQPARRGSIFLIALGLIVIMFILAFSMTYFTGSEDYSSAISYESEIAFNLAESAIEEFVARLKYSLNHDDANNQLFKVLREADEGRLGKEIPLEAVQVANLTKFTRETAKNVYEIQFTQGNVKSNDFVVEATIKLKGMDEIKQETYILRKDKKEKQGELSVKAHVTFKGRSATVSLVFLIRVVKVFVPPFNYFTLYVKNGTSVGPTNSAMGGSNFNVWSSQTGEQKKFLNLDNGWRSIPGHENFDAVRDVDYWEKELAAIGNDAAVPPGRVYLGKNPEDQNGVVMVQSTNGTKLMRDSPTDRMIEYQCNAQENLFLKQDIKWMGMKTFVKDVMKLQTSVEDVKTGILFSPWSDDTKIKMMNIGAGHELAQNWFQDVPAFNNALGSYKMISGNQRTEFAAQAGPELAARFYPEVDKSGLHLFGNAPPIGGIDPASGKINTASLSPTLVYGPVMKMFYRVVSLGDKDVDISDAKKGVRLELPFVGTQKDQKTNKSPIMIPPDLLGKKNLTATDVKIIFQVSGVSNNPTDQSANYLDKLMSHWETVIPKPFKEIKGDGEFQYDKFMSNQGMELYNEGLGNFIYKVRNRGNDKYEAYDGELKNHFKGFLTNQEAPNTHSALQAIARKSPMQEFFLGDLYYAMPDDSNSFLMDFYFIPRSTEDFFRGRTTISVGGISRDRFIRKYINDADAYENNQPNQVLELNGVLALNDPAPLILGNLLFRGRGIIYSSPMMGGGDVVIKGDFMPASAKIGTTVAAGSNSEADPDMITIVAPRITIEADSAKGDICYVEANLISVSGPITVTGDKQVRIKGTVACPYLDLGKAFPSNDPNKKAGGEIIYNPLNSIWRKIKPQLMDQLYVAKIVTGGVGKFEWKYDRE